MQFLGMLPLCFDIKILILSRFFIITRDEIDFLILKQKIDFFISRNAKMGLFFISKILSKNF